LRTFRKYVVPTNHHHNEEDQNVPHFRVERAGIAIRSGIFKEPLEVFPGPFVRPFSFGVHRPLVAFWMTPFLFVLLTQ
jgi:hypothetical protein